MESSGLRRRGGKGSEAAEDETRSLDQDTMSPGPPSDGEEYSDEEQYYRDSDSEGSIGEDVEWTEEDEAEYQKRKAEFEVEAPDDTWMLLAALLGFLACGTAAAFIPKYVVPACASPRPSAAAQCPVLLRRYTGLEKDYVMAAGMFLMIGYVTYLNFIAPLLGCTKADGEDDDISPSSVFIVASSMGVLIGGLMSSAVQVLL